MLRGGLQARRSGADTAPVRLSLIAAACLGALALAAGASAGVPRFALFDVHSGLAAASHNSFGDVKVWKRSSALAAHAHGATLVRCGLDCTYGAGWLAFVQAPALSAGDVSAAKALRVNLGWTVFLTLTPTGHARFARFDTKATLAGARRGISDALVLVVDGAIVAQPLQNQLRAGKTTLEIPGLTRANALRAAKLFGH
jgi:hypothetical protein